jgi:arylsulfatase A-like enzyme
MIALVGLLVSLASCISSEASPRRASPNIVIILADDLGYGDLGVQGAVDRVTPRIDRLAAEGVRMTHFYAAHPTCAPSRAGLLTGRYQQRFGFESNPAPVHQSDPDYGLPLSEPTLAERLRLKGYATGMVGKWHLGYQDDKAPEARGFDVFYGLRHGSMAYVPEGSAGLKTVYRGPTVEPMPQHTTEAFADEATAFIRNHRASPFFLYVSFNAVHAPMQSTERYLSRFSAVADPKRRAYLAMLSALDEAVGRIVDEIDAAGLGRDTLIVFTSDNGGPTWQTTASNGSLNGVKALLLEGGIRVPAIFRRTGEIPPGRVLETPAIGQDIAVTALAAAGLSPRGDFDGRDLSAFLKGERTGSLHPTLYWRALSQGAARTGDWKVLKADGAWFLFNLRTDPGERRDLSREEPERLERMRRDWEAWSSGMMSPRWVREDLPGGENRPRELRKLIEDYVAGAPVSPREVLYGGGPE